MPLLTALRRYLAVDDPWERPGGSIDRRDVALTAATAILSLVTLELMRGVGSLDPVEEPVWLQWLLTAGPALLLLARRRWPLAVLVVGSVAYWAIGTFAGLMASLLSTQVVYFVVVHAGVAWARRRSQMVLVVGGVLLGMAAWLVWGYAVGNVLDQVISAGDDSHRPRAVVSSVLLTTLINIVFFGAAVMFGQNSWRNARQRGHLQEQARTITEQAEELSERAVVEERLRIARELHDVVAHHVSVIGVQAAGARRVMERDPAAAKGALSVIEESSRDAVTQMRSLLGGKGANLAEMANLGLPVPPGFTIPTSVCTYFYDHDKTYPKELKAQVEKALDYVGKLTGKTFGDAKNPLLVSVRSGARASMPGMMDTVLNLGLNDRTVQNLVKLTGDERFAYDSYRRFIQMYADVVLELDHALPQADQLDVPGVRVGG